MASEGSKNSIEIAVYKIVINIPEKKQIINYEPEIWYFNSSDFRPAQTKIIGKKTFSNLDDVAIYLKNKIMEIRQETDSYNFPYKIIAKQTYHKLELPSLFEAVDCIATRKVENLPEKEIRLLKKNIKDLLSFYTGSI